MSRIIRKDEVADSPDMVDDERHGTGDHTGDDTGDEDALRLPSLRSAFRRGRKPEPPPDAEPAPDDSPGPVTVAERDVEPEAERDVEREAEPRQRRSLRIHLPGPLAAAGTGVLVGLALVGLTAAGLHGCTSVRGTSSCGKPGILLLLVITVAAILLGSLLLRLAGVAAHGSTSFLAVAVLEVLILLALLPVLDDWWVVFVVPALSMLSFLGSWWLTTRYPDAP